MTSNFKKAATIAARSLTPGKPHHVQWMITRRCNYHCRGCNIPQEQDPNELSAKEIKRGLDILKDLGIVEIVFSGGDPLLREDAQEIIDYAANRFVTTVYDNGSMAAKKVDALRNVNFAAISIDSLDPAKNDYIKGVPGAWKNAMNSVDTLQREGINVAVTPTISQMNLYEIMDITKYFTGRGVPVWYCLYSFDLSTDVNQLFRIGKANDEFLITDNQGMVDLIDSLTKLRKTNKRVLMTTRLLKALRSLYSEDKRTWNCQALRTFFVIDHTGRIAGCHVHNIAGSIFDLSKTWKSDKFDDLRKTYKQCSQCTYLCYIFYSLHGSPYGNLLLAKDQWKNSQFLLKNSAKPLNTAKTQ